MSQLLTVSKTRSTKIRRFFTLKSNRVETKFQKVMCGKNEHIRTNDVSGIINMAELQENVLIDGCDWLGALSIWYYLNPYHESISKNGVFYFMIPPEAIMDISGSTFSSEIVFFAFFHHLYNIFLLKDPWTTPPFRTSLDQKYAYVQTLLLENLCAETDESLNSVLVEIQTSLKMYPYKSWLEIRSILLNPWTKEIKPIEFDIEYRKSILEKEFDNSEQILYYLECSIDQYTVPPKIVVRKHGPIKNFICELLLKKIDEQTIFLKTGVAPIYINWLKELDFFLYRLSRDGV